MKKRAVDYCKEWLDTLVVAISVAMCFRAYFYEPFNIPTGSMQPTLWGYHTVANTPETKWDSFPLSSLKWLWTGEKHLKFVADAPGTARVMPRHDGFADVQVGLSRRTFRLPVDAARSLAGKSFRRGETVWEGAQVSGDFIFVNRWRWNFLRPQVGEVMIFSTTGIRDLVQGTHYIKRMKARPGDTYRLEHPVSDPPGLPTVVTMGENEYFACGDNFNNSYDSRYWGPVPSDKLRGSGSFVFWPCSKWRVIR